METSGINIGKFSVNSIDLLLNLISYVRNNCNLIFNHQQYKTVYQNYYVHQNDMVFYQGNVRQVI